MARSRSEFDRSDSDRGSRKTESSISRACECGFLPLVNVTIEQAGKAIHGVVDIGIHQLVTLRRINDGFDGTKSFLTEQLKPDLLVAACEDAGQHFEFRMQPDYDHSYYFIQTFVEDHLRHHARYLTS